MPTITTINNTDVTSSSVSTLNTNFANLNNGVLQKTRVTVGTAFGADYVCTGITDDVQINAAISAVNAAGGGVVFIRAGTYQMSSALIFKSDVYIVGEGIGVTVLVSGVAFDYVARITGTVGTTDFGLSNLTINVNNASHGSGVRIEYATRATFKNLRIVNVPANGWGMVVGVANGADSVYRNFDVRIKDCFFDTQAGTLEMLLLFNAQRVQVTGCDFNNQIGGPGLGIYQNCDSIKIHRCTFRSIAGPALYYSLSTNNITISSSDFYGAGGVQGANLSDNGSFGSGVVTGLKIHSCYFTTCVIALALGATDGAIISQCTFENNAQIGIILSQGYTGVSSLSTNWHISQCTFRHNNTVANNSALHPAILFQAIAGSMYGILSDCTFYDNSPGGATDQIVPITFTGPFTWDYIQIINCRLTNYDMQNVSLWLDSGAALGDSVIVRNNFDLNPDGFYQQGNVTGSTTFTRQSGAHITATLVGAITVTLISGVGKGDELVLELTQDAIGSRTATWPSNFKKAGGTLTLSTAANAVDTITMRWDGTNWREVSRAMNQS